MKRARTFDFLQFCPVRGKILLFRKPFAKRQNFLCQSGRQENNKMATSTIQHSSANLKKLTAPFLTMWDMFPIGVMITDVQGNVIFYNQTFSMIDKFPVKSVIGRNVRDLYGPDPGPSLVLSCLESGKPVINYVCVYRTYKGEIVNSAHWIYPIFEDRTLLGCICFVQRFDSLTEPPAVSSIQDLPNGNCDEINLFKLVSKNPEMLKAISSAKLAAENPSPVVLYGETGTGKDVFARNIHGSSMWRSNPFVALNCAAIPENLLEGLLFGTTRGAFTGAMDKPGLFEQANGGTLFLDETDSMPLILQTKLLRVLQDKTIRRIGSDQEIHLNLKIISAMSQDPLASVNAGKLRSDLFYRLGVIVIGIPPLRDRREDIEDLCTYFILKYNALFGKKVKSLSPNLLNMFYRYNWPGNVRELEHIIEATMNFTYDKECLKSEMVPDYFLKKLTEKHAAKGEANAVLPSEYGTYQNTCDTLNGVLPHYVQPEQIITSPTIGDDEKTFIINALTITFGNVTMAAKMLNLSRQNLSYKLKKYGLNRKDFRKIA